jgi:hypothetical protein
MIGSSLRRKIRFSLSLSLSLPLSLSLIFLVHGFKENRIISKARRVLSPEPDLADILISVLFSKILQNCEEMNMHCSSHQVYETLLWHLELIEKT